MAQPPLYPTLTPRLVDPAWFQVDKPVDLALELKVWILSGYINDVWEGIANETFKEHQSVFCFEIINIF